MGSHPVNLAFRFFLELSAVFIFAVRGWRSRDDGFRILVAIVFPLLAASVWGIFAVPNDPSRSGSAPVPTPGVVRLLLELGFFALAVWALHGLGFARLAAILGMAVALHYAVSYDRIRWLFRQ